MKKKGKLFFMVYIFCRDQDLFTPVLIKFLRQTVLIYSLALIIALRYNRENKLMDSFICA